MKRGVISNALATLDANSEKSSTQKKDESTTTKNDCRGTGSTTRTTPVRRSLHKRYFSISKEARTGSSGSDETEKSKLEPSYPATQQTVAAALPPMRDGRENQETVLASSSNSLTLNRKLIKRFGSLSPGDKEFVRKVFEGEEFNEMPKSNGEVLGETQAN